MYNIYFKNRLLTICEKDNPLINSNDTILLHPSNDYKLSDVPYMMETNLNFKHLVIADIGSINQDEIFKRVFSKVSHHNAAGGVVINEKGEYLMIFRNGVWDLPKGKQEDNENIVVTAQREVREECGLDVVPNNLICTTHHVYRLNKQLIVKHTYWYAMPYGADAEPVPQTDEGIEKCVWVTKEDLPYKLANSYASINEVFTNLGIDF